MNRKQWSRQRTNTTIFQKQSGTKIKPFLANVTNGNVDSDDDSLEYVENMLRQSNPSLDRIDQSNIVKKKQKSLRNVKKNQINVMKISKKKSKQQQLFNRQIVNSQTKKKKNKKTLKKNNKFNNQIIQLQSIDGNKIKIKKKLK